MFHFFRLHFLCIFASISEYKFQLKKHLKDLKEIFLQISSLLANINCALCINFCVQLKIEIVHGYITVAVSWLKSCFLNNVVF